MQISIIGAGNIGSAFVEGLLREGSVDPSNISLADISQEALAPFTTKGVNAIQDNAIAVRNADIVVLCVKPYLVCDVIKEIIQSLTDDVLLISFAAGVSLDQLTVAAGKRPLFRIIPNTAMFLCQSMTCIAASDHTTIEQRNTIIQLFTGVGKAMIIDEALMDAATVVASCGTAFALRYLHATMAAAVEIGFRPAVAKEMIAQTMLGAAMLVAESGNHPEVEIDKVTTPKGLTISGLNEMERAGFSSATMQGIRAAFAKLKG
jgi:pyrroline-5-carboxylate reductase